MPSPEPTAPPPDEQLIRGIRRWRMLARWGGLAVTVVVFTGFFFERLAKHRTQQTETVVRLASQAQRLVLQTESAARQIAIDGDTAAYRRMHLTVERLDPLLDSLWQTVLTSPVMPTHTESAVDSIRATIAAWVTTLPEAPRPGVRPLASAAVRAHDDTVDAVTRYFAFLVDSRFKTHATVLAQQERTAWVAFSILLLAMAAAAVAFVRVSSGLGIAAREAIAHQRRTEEQATELEQQAAQLEEQAQQLEEQSDDLRASVLDRDEANRRLQQAAVFLDSAVESAPFGIAFFDRAFRYHRINPALAAINGALPDAHLGRRLEDMLPDLVPMLRPHMERVLATGVAEPNVVVEPELPSRPGEKQRHLVTFYPIARAGEPPLGVGVMVLDITEQSRLERQLRQAQKMEAVGRLAGGIAHDFNNVLTVIQSYAEVLAMELEEKHLSLEEVNAIRGAADRAAQLARQLLAFSRRDVVIPRDMDVSEIIRGLDLILRRLLRQGVDLHVELTDTPLIVHMDAGQVEQVLMNLCINAVDAMPRGGTLRIRTERAPSHDGRRGRAVLSVEDTGTGMTAEVQERLFEPFFTTKPAGHGTGLGLATTYTIVKEVGGEILVTSAPGHGSRFDVILPLSSSAVADAPAGRFSPTMGTPAIGAGERILLVEDEPAIRAAIARILIGTGYEVLEAANGGEALRLVEADPGEIHLVLSDVMMPGIGGKELVSRLLAVRPGIRVILMSGFTDDADLRTELGTARFLFVQKPFSSRRILNAVREALALPVT